MSSARERYLEIWGAYRARGIEGMLPYCTPDFVVEEYAGAPGAQTWHGVDGLMRMWSRWEEDLDGFAFEAEGQPVQLGDEVFAVPVRVRGTGRAGGVRVDWRLIMVSVMRDGFIAHQMLVDSMDEARARIALT